MTRFLALTLVILTFTFLTGCGASHDEAGESSSTSPTIAVADKQLNISLLLDLSDRIEPTKYPSSPEHFERDIEIAKTLTDFFRSDMEQKGAFQAEGKIRTIFSPPPEDRDINRIAQQLEVDLTGMQPAGKKTVYDSLGVWYETNLQRIYDSVIESKNYVGADIWRFFKEGRVRDYCIDPDPSYRNILVILTDGYMYHEASEDRVGNRTAYVTGLYLNREGFRNNPNWREKFESGDYGFFSDGQRFDNLEVLVLEVNPSDNHPNDFDILKVFWSKWFDEMGIDRYRLIQSDLPVNTEKTIMRFLNSPS